MTINSTNACGGNLADRKIGLQLVDSVSNCEVDEAHEAFYLVLHVTLGSAVGCFKGRTIDLELALALDINLFVALNFIWVVIRIAGGPPGGWGGILIVSGWARDGRRKLGARGSSSVWRGSHCAARNGA